MFGGDGGAVRVRRRFNLVGINRGNVAVVSRSGKRVHDGGSAADQLGWLEYIQSEWQGCHPGQVWALGRTGASGVSVHMVGWDRQRPSDDQRLLVPEFHAELYADLQ